MCKRIPLSQGKFAIVDDADYEWLSQYKWYACKGSGGYCALRKETNGKSVLMHREIMGFPKGYDVDHLNGNRADNRRENLRVCSHRVNCQNRKPNTNGSSKYKGVHWFSVIGKWSVRIRHNNKIIFLGNYDSEVEAAKAYDIKAKELGRTRRSYNFD